jgi:hypothetical protein
VQRLAGDVVDVAGAFVHHERFERGSVLGSTGLGCSSLYRVHDADVEEVILRSDDRPAGLRLLPGRQLAKHQSVLKDAEVLVDRRTGYLRVVGDGSQVDHRSVAQRSDVEEPAERGGVASRALSYDLLLRVGPGIRPEVGRRIVREGDHREQATPHRSVQVEAIVEFVRGERSSGQR